MVRVTSEQRFKEDVLQAGSKVLVDFWAPWCGPCRVVDPILERVERKASGSAAVYTINVDENPALVDRYGITGIPTVILFEGGSIQNRFVGVQPEQVYLNALN